MMHQPIPDLTQAEWTAVSIALKDADTGICTSGSKSIVGKVLRVITGNEPATPLADPRLEAVRSFVCDTRRHRRPSQRMKPVLEAQGFNARQIEALALLAA